MVELLMPLTLIGDPGYGMGTSTVLGTQEKVAQTVGLVGIPRGNPSTPTPKTFVI